ncbi:MAG: antitoxin [Propionibacteriaceae bacterium]|nr:antitoxin [Propionibacteriaceae bacterium]
MTDVLIRGVAEPTLQRLDAMASHLGLSRSAFLRRQIERLADMAVAPTTDIDWGTFAAAHQDLGDPEVMSQAWR